MATTNLTHVIGALLQAGVPSRSCHRVEISTSLYERSHGKRPGGFGSWAFEIRRGGIDEPKLRTVIEKFANQPGLVGCPSLEEAGGTLRVWMPSSTYGEAKAAVVRLLAAFGSGVIEVAP
ncbi:MAG TPA: hypothetical protein VF151_10985 [Gemmatimonadales bacterium]